MVFFLQRDSELFRAKQRELERNKISEFRSFPPPNHIQLNVFGQIETAYDFDESNL